MLLFGMLFDIRQLSIHARACPFRTLVNYYYYYLAGCPMFPHIPAPISQSCDLSPPIVSISPIFFL